MKNFILASLIALPTYAFADAPKGPDFDAHAPMHSVDPSLVASSGERPILPTDDVTFPNESAWLHTAEIDALHNTAQWLKEHPRYRIVLEGHASSVGTHAYNEDLATQRVNMVRKQLMKYGVSPERVVLVVYGEVGAQHPVNPNDRRVIMYASDQPVQRIVTASLDNDRAIKAAWMRNGALVEQQRSIVIGTR